MKVIFFLQYDTIGSSSKYRVLIYKNKFDEAYETKYCYFWDNQYVSEYSKAKKKYLFQILAAYTFNVLKRIWQMVFTVPKYDVLVIQRCMIPYIPISFLTYVKRRGVRIIYDIDDALHLEKGYNCSKIAGQADAVMVGNKLLHDYYKQYNLQTFIVPTVDNNHLYQPFVKDTYEKKCIGWIGSFSTVRNFDIIIKVLNRITEEHSEVYVKIISDEVYEYQEKIHNCKFVPWDADTYLQEMQEFTIGIMPLKESAFNAGKCGFKLIQYLDLEKPVVATDLGENATIVSDYGYICTNEDEWYRALTTLLFDEKTYRKCVANIQSKFLHDYGFDANLQKIMDVIEEK